MLRSLSRLSAALPVARTTRFAPTSDSDMSNPPVRALNTRSEWQAEIAKLPTLEENGGKIPSVFLAHGRESSLPLSRSAFRSLHLTVSARPVIEPMLILPPHLAKDTPMLATLGEIQGPDGLLSQFLQDFGPTLLEKYRPRAIVVLSAHYETDGGGVVTDYGDENPLLHDYFGFPRELYETKFHSSGDSNLARQIVDRLRAAGIEQSRLTTTNEPRGRDGRGFNGPGFDHGVFVPFKLMFGEEAPVPIVQVSIPSDLSPRSQRSLGEALEPFRSEGVLIISGGLTVHTFQDFSAFSPRTAKPIYLEFEAAVVAAVAEPDRAARAAALDALPRHAGFRLAHPREEHFVPIYIAAGAAHESERTEAKAARIVCGLYGAKSAVFGV